MNGHSDAVDHQNAQAIADEQAEAEALQHFYGTETITKELFGLVQRKDHARTVGQDRPGAIE